MVSQGKIGISCGCRKLNYGSILQSYALYKVIEDIGYDCEFVWIKGNFLKHYNIRWSKICGIFSNTLKHPSIFPIILKSIYEIFVKKSSYSLSKQSIYLFERFLKKNIFIRYYTWNSLKKYAGTYSKFVCGSDQIWNSYEYYMDPMYFLRFAPINKRVAYAPSFGADTVSYYNRKILKKYLLGFNTISVREKSGSKICRELIKRDVPVVMDPTLLLTEEMWMHYLNLQKKEQNYCLVYFLNNPSLSALELIKLIRERMTIKVLPIKYNFCEKGEFEDAGPSEFLQLLLNAKYVVTDSFHGTIFAINFHKQFVCFERQYTSKEKQSSRITDILLRFDLSERYRLSSEEVFSSQTWDILRKKIDYNAIENKISAFRDESYHFLKTSLEE